MALYSTDYLSYTDNLNIIDSVFNEAVRTAAENSTYEKVFNFQMTDMQNITHHIDHGIGGVAQTAEGQDYPEATGDEGGSTTYTNKKYAASIPVTYEMRRYRYSNPHKFDALLGRVESIVDEAIANVDTSCANILTDGFATSHTDVWGQTFSGTGADAVALFSASHLKHTGNSAKGTFSNIIVDSSSVSNPALSRDALYQAWVTGQKYQDGEGVRRKVNIDTLLVAPEQYDLAVRLVQSDLIAQRADNDTNKVLKGIFKNIVVWDKLSTKADGTTDASSQWYVYDSSKINETLKGYWVDTPTLQAPDTFPTNDDWNYKFRMLYSRGFGFAPYIMASTGAN